MKPIASLLPSLSLALALAAPAESAVQVDLDLARLRAAPGAESVAERLRAAMPEAARERLALLDGKLGFVPGRDLSRVVIDIGDDGTPTLLLVGLPATGIAGLLASAGADAVTVAGRAGHVLPKHPKAAFIVLAADRAAVVRADATALPSLPAAQPNAVTLQATPRPEPVLPFMRQVSAVNLASDGAGHLSGTFTCHDEPAAIEAERRIGLLKAMPGDRPLLNLVRKAVITRDGNVLTIGAEIDQATRNAAIDRLLGRLTGKG